MANAIDITQITKGTQIKLTATDKNHMVFIVTGKTKTAFTGRIERNGEKWNDEANIQFSTFSNPHYCNSIEIINPETPDFSSPDTVKVENKIAVERNAIDRIDKQIEDHRKQFAKNQAPYHTNRIQDLQRMAGKKEDQIKLLEAELQRIKEGLQSAAGLVKVLAEATVEMLEIYIEQTAKWAVKKVAQNIARLEKYHNWFKDIPMKDRKYTREYYTERKWVHSAQGYFFSHDEFLSRAIDGACEHYRGSLVKLAIRAIGKGLNQDKCSVKYGRVDVNITCTITDGTQKVNAFTVMASGPIQCPHYRFLVK